MALNKFYKRKDKPLSTLEEQVGKAIIEVEKSSAENKALLKGFLVDSCKEIETSYNGKKSKSLILITIPYICSKVKENCSKVLIQTLERKLNHWVAITWIKTHKSQMRPRTRTLTQVHENILDDLIQPSVILAKRIRVKLDGSKLYKVSLDKNDQSVLESKTYALSQVYKQLCQKEVDFDFIEDKQFYTLPQFK